jgi:hypothetical protein
VKRNFETRKIVDTKLIYFLEYLLKYHELVVNIATNKVLVTVLFDVYIKLIRRTLKYFVKLK